MLLLVNPQWGNQILLLVLVGHLLAIQMLPTHQLK
jgi:hypothetical protein